MLRLQTIPEAALLLAFTVVLAAIGCQAEVMPRQSVFDMGGQESGTVGSRSSPPDSHWKREKGGTRYFDKWPTVALLWDQTIGDGPVLATTLPDASPCGKSPPAHPPAWQKGSSPLTPALLAEDIRGNTLSPPWTTSRDIAVHKAHVVVIDADNSALVAIPLDQLTWPDVKMNAAPVQTWSLPQEGQPHRLLIDSQGRVMVSLRSAGAIAVHTLIAQTSSSATSGSGTPTSPWKPGPQWSVPGTPGSIALTVSELRLAVALVDSDQVALLETKSGNQVALAKTYANPSVVAFGPADSLLVALASGTAQETALSGDQLTFATATQVSLHVPSSRVTSPVAVRPVAISQASDNGFIVGHSVANTGLATEAVGVARLAGTVAGAAIGESAAEKPVPPYYGGAASAFATSAPLVVAATHISGAQTGPFKLGQSSFPFGSAPRDIGDMVAHPTHALQAIVFRGSEEVALVREASTVKPVHRLYKVGAGPSAAVFTPDGTHLLVHDRLDLAITVIPLAGGSAEQYQKASARYAKSPLSAEIRAGRRLFHRANNKAMSFLGDFSCASCHPAGGEDGLAWLGSVGIRQTPALAGRLEGTAPFNWQGGSKSLTSNMQMTVHRMSGDGLCAEELQWLEAFLTKGLKATANPHLAVDGKLTSQQAEGKALFEDPAVGCALCHAPGTFTNGQRYDVGTASQSDKAVAAELAERFAKGIAMKLGWTTPTKLAELKARFVADVQKLDTPSLRGVWRTAPYLHDGSAPTLLDVLEVTDGTMGKTGHLSNAQKQALVAYLQTL